MSNKYHCKNNKFLNISYLYLNIMHCSPLFSFFLATFPRLVYLSNIRHWCINASCGNDVYSFKVRFPKRSWPLRLSQHRLHVIPISWFPMRGCGSRLNLCRADRPWRLRWEQCIATVASDYSQYKNKYLLTTKQILLLQILKFRK